MSWLVLYFGIQAGIWSGRVTAQQPNSIAGLWSAPENATEITADFRLAFLDEHFEITGLLRSYQIQEWFTSFYPFRMDYGIGANLRFGAITFRVEHECDHGWSRLPFCGTFNGNFDQISMWHTEFSVRVEGSAKLF